jgi:hypothetical protein
MYSVPPFLKQRIDSFTGRVWLLNAVKNWLADAERKRFFVLTGGPGTGKSMIAAWLWGAGPTPAEPGARAKLIELRDLVGATHFCGDGGGNRDPKTAAQNIAAQLEEKVPGFRDAVLEGLDSGIRAEVNVRVDSAAPQSMVAGLLIQNLGSLSGEIAFNRLVRDPLKKVYAKGYDQRLILIIDSMDEAENFSGDVRIPYLISNLSDLPSQVSILVTTRADERVLQYFPVACSRRVDLVEDAPTDVDDIQLYAEQNLWKLDEATARDLAVEISTRAQGVFLYASLIIPELIAAIERGEDPRKFPLPQGLTDLYRMFLGRELTRDKGKWFKSYAPLLGSVAIAQGAGLCREQLERLVGPAYREALLTCRQYLVAESSRGPFRIFHQSFVQLLFDEEAMGSYRIEPREMHHRIVESYKEEYTGRWDAIDDYGMDHLLWHLLELDTDEARRAAIRLAGC